MPSLRAVREAPRGEAPTPALGLPNGSMEPPKDFSPLRVPLRSRVSPRLASILSPAHGVRERAKNHAPARAASFIVPLLLRLVGQPPASAAPSRGTLGGDEDPRGPPAALRTPQEHPSEPPDRIGQQLEGDGDGRRPRAAMQRPLQRPALAGLHLPRTITSSPTCLSHAPTQRTARRTPPR